MKVFIRKYKWLLIALNGALLSLLIVDIFVVKAHFDDNAFIWKIIMAECGSFTKNYHYFNDLFLLQYIFQWFYGVWPSVPWFTFFCLGADFLSIVIIANLLFVYALKKGHSVYSSLIGVALAVLFLHGNLLWIHHNRVAFLMASSALLGQMVGTQLGFGNRWGYRLFCIGWFLLAALVRPESALASLALGGIIFLLVYGFKFRVLFAALIPYVSLMAVLFGYYVYQINFSSLYYYRLEPDGEYEIIDRKNVVPLSDMKTPADSAKYKAATSFMLADVKEVNPKFIRSLIKKDNSGWDRYFFYLNKSPHRGTFFNMEKVTQLWLHLDEVFFLFALCLAFLLLEKKYSAALRILLYFLFAMVMFMSLFSFNNFRRVVEPLAGITVLWVCLLYYSFASGGEKGKSRLLIYGFLLALVGIFYFRNFSSAWEESVFTEKTEKEMDENVHRVIEGTNRKYVVWVGNHYAPSDIYSTSLEYGSKQPLYMEFGQFSGNKYYLATIATITGCPEEDFACRLQFLKNNRGNMLIMSTPKKLNHYNEYARKVYDMEVGLDTTQMRLVYGRLHALEMPY